MRKARLVLCLAALPFGACKCRGGLNGTNGSLVANPPSLSFAVGVGKTQKLTTTITNKGDAPLTINLPITVTGPAAAAFAANLAPDAGRFLDLGGTTVLDVSFSPTAFGDGGATVVVDNDTGIALDVPVWGDGEDACHGVVCDAGLCFGSCVAGACQYAGSCVDSSQCLSNGSCNPTTGACEGTSDCQTGGPGPGLAGAVCNVPSAVCSGKQLKGNVPPGSCNPGSGCCEYTQKTVDCDCACVTNGNSASCLYQWEPAPTPPPTTGTVATVWASGQAAGDLWVAEYSGNGGAPNQNTVYQLQNGTWQQVAQVTNAFSNLSSGLILSGSSDQDVYGAIDCTQVSTTGCLQGQTSCCTAGGAWHWSGSAAADEPFTPATFPSCASSTVSPTNLPFTPILDIDGVGFALNTDCTGPELESNAPTASCPSGWCPAYNFHWYCQNLDSLWGASSTDLWVAGSGCSAGGQIVHYNGSGIDSPKTYPLPVGELVAAMWGSNSSDIWAVGTHRWHYDGTRWTEDVVAPPVPNNDNALWGNGADYYAGGTYIQLYHWAQGTDWTEECVAPGYGGPTITSFASDGLNVYATATPSGSATNGQLVQRCPNGQCP